MSRCNVFWTFACLVTTIGVAAAVDCYKCTAIGELNHHCQDPFHKENYQDKIATCDGYCEKYKVKIDFVSRITRSCKTTCKEQHTEYLGTKIHVTCCQTDLCNVTSRVRTANNVLCFAVVVAILLANFRSVM